MAQLHFQDVATTVYTASPRFEGSNICSWIGFKHVMYLVEEAILQHFRERGLQPRRMFEEFGLCLEIVDSRVRILHALHMDDVVQVKVQPVDDSSGGEFSHNVQLFVERDGETLKALTGKVKVLFRRDRSGVTAGALPDEISAYVHDEIIRTKGAPAPATGFSSSRADEPLDEAIIRQLVPPDANAFVWKWHIPYFYCHFTERIQHSGYLRLMEEVVDLFLADRGISIRTMLDTRRWIPVVPEARVEILREGLMEETIYTVYTVEDIFKDVTYTARMDCYVLRDGGLIHTATGRIVHGYAEILNRRDWALVPFDAETAAALRGATR